MSTTSPKRSTCRSRPSRPICKSSRVAGLIRTETQKGRKGNQKLCYSAFDEVLVRLRDDPAGGNGDAIDVAMPIGLYTNCEVSAPCGLCSPQGIIGLA